MKVTNRLTVVALVACAVFVVGSPAMADGATIAVLTKNQTNPQFQVMRIGAAKAAAAAHDTVINYVPTHADSIPEQMGQLQDLVVKHPTGVVLVPVDNKALAPAIAAVNQAGIPIVNLNDRAEAGTFVSFVGLSDHDLAVAAANFLGNALGGKGKVVIIEGIKGSRSSEDRLAGFHDGLKGFPAIQIVASQPANNQRIEAANVMDNLIQSLPDIDGVLTINDSMAMGAASSLEAAGRQAKIASINGTREVAGAILQGKILASVVSDGFAMGCVATDALIRHLGGEEVPKEIILPFTVINKANADQWTIKAEDRTCPTWNTVVK
jgi:ribose transport system substrate-binding protein